MNTTCIDNYVFRVGDYVETKDGEVGYIKEIVPQNEHDVYIAPYIVCMLNNKEKCFYIADIITYSNMRDYFNRIGLYDFTNDLKEENDIKPLVNSYLFDHTFDCAEVIKKINELVNAVNELRREK